MALRAFHANPSIGGFGNENSNVLPLGDPLARKNNRTNDDSRVDVGGEDFSNESGDALCQIVKELVDNAVDACETARKDYAGSIVYRVKVEIRPYRNNSDDNTLQVTVSDNGCGMKDIQACVNAFQSSKGGYSNTVGRYGIGLTLCLLHAQRLVWGTYSCITSATKESTSFKRALYIVNTDGDSVECHREEEVEKGHAAESGTCVSLLVPGGRTAEVAWQRLEHYLRRFQLSPVECSIEVLAPTFSTVPIHILKKSRDVDKASLQQQESKLTECLDDDPEEDHVSPKMIAGAFLARRKAVQEMAQRYDFFRRPLQLQNIAHSVHDIRIKSSYSCPSNPKMILNVIVSPHEETMSENSQDSTACLELVRMVNSVPLLDGAESFACGLVKSLQSSVLWASFGLTIVESIDSATNSWTSHFAIRDSDRVAPFLRSRNHQLWEAEQDHDSVGGENPEEKGTEKRKRETNDQMLMLPAKVRLGKILLLVNVDAVPTVLPLPTLSKGRLPINHLPITQALHLALRDCLRSLQQTSPGLFLTTAQLRTIERDEIYIPLMASAASGILGRMLSVSRQHKLLEKVHKIQMEDGTGSLHSRKTDMVSSGDEVVLTITSRTILLIRKIESERKKKKRQIKSSKDEDQSNDEYFDIEKVENDGQKRCAQSNESEESKSALAITWDDSDIGKDSPAYKSNLNTLLQHEESEKSPRNEIISEGIGDDYDSDDEWW